MTAQTNQSEDELELERFVFGDSDGITKRISGGDAAKALQNQSTELEHLEDDQVFSWATQTDVSSSSSIPRKMRLGWPKQWMKERRI